MRTMSAVAIVLSLLVSPGLATDKAGPVERGTTVSVRMHFDSAVQSGSALLLWQTFDDSAVRQRRDKGMTLSFRCSGTFAQTGAAITVPCTIPSGVADGHYYLVSVSVGDDQHRRTYGWQGDLPVDLTIDVKGGPTDLMPNMSTIRISGTNATKR